MKDLLPCPICGRTVWLSGYTDEAGDLHKIIVCACGLVYDVSNTDEGYEHEAWNHRPAEDKLRADLETCQIERNYRPRMDDYEKLQADLAKQEDIARQWADLAMATWIELTYWEMPGATKITDAPKLAIKWRKKIEQLEDSMGQETP
jgi:transcription initiation factor TFIIIB Brf1 subunit/transcription initiation factor TFIIB